jgi:hypothetical protein
MALFAVCAIAGSASAFEFVNSEEAMNVGGGIGFGGYGGFSYYFQAELPPYGDLAFLAAIPGFGMDLLIGMDGSFFIQNALCLRAMAIDKLCAKAGLGVGFCLGDDGGFYVPIVVGADYLVLDNLAATARVSIPVVNSNALNSPFRFDVGVSWATGY